MLANRAGVALAAILVSVTWWPLTATSSWWVSVLCLILLAAVTAAAADMVAKRWWPAAEPAVGTVTAGLTLIGGLTATATNSSGALLVIPTRQWLAGFVERWQAGLQQANVAVAPVPAEPALLMVMTVSLVVLWLLADAAGTATGHPAGAALPLLAMFAVPASTLHDGLPLPHFLAAAAGLVVLLLLGADDWLADRGRRVDHGPGVPPWRALGIGSAAVVTALVVSTSLPGLSGGLVQRLRDPGGGRLGGSSTALSPDLDLHRDLTSRSDTSLLRYSTSAPDPQPMRVFTVDAFDTDTWQVVGQEAAAGEPEATLRLDQKHPAGAEPVETVVEITGLRQRSLPYPAPAHVVRIAGWSYEPLTASVRSDEPTGEDTSYSVRHYQPVPDGSFGSAPFDDVDPRWLAVPDGSQALADQAVAVAGQGTPLQQAQRLQSFFRTSGGFTYTLDVPQQTGPSAMQDFLSRRSGYCVHYATAMTVMARTLGIPARVAVGVLPGERVGGQESTDGQQVEVWEVSERDAHAWPELYLRDAGWVRFEPTPGARSGVAPPGTEPSAGATPTAQPTPQAQQADPTPAAAQQQPPDQAGRQADADARSGRWRWVLLAVVVVGIVAGVPRLVVTVRRRRRWAGAATSATVAEVAWTDLQDRVGDLGVRWASSATVQARADHLRDEVRTTGARSAVARRAEAITAARYAPRPRAGTATTLRDRDRARKDVETVVAEVAAERSTWQQIVASWWPSGWWR